MINSKASVTSSYINLFLEGHYISGISLLIGKDSIQIDIFF